MKTVLFVCTGNLCRSPMATVLLQQRLAAAGLSEKISVESAGVWARDGAQASETARQVMQERGLNLEDHRARTVTEGMLAKADLVLVMEEAHRGSLFHLGMQHLRKIFLLAEMSGRHFDVPDPYGGTRADYERAVKQLDSLLETGFPRIVKQLKLESATTDSTPPAPASPA